MPNKAKVSVENNFTKGLITEFTGLNFPMNAATDCDNVNFDLVGHVKRRFGIDRELNFGTYPSVGTTLGIAPNEYVWKNVAGDGNTQILVCQFGAFLYFYSITDATVISPISRHIIDSGSLAFNVPSGGTFDSTQFCEFAEGNGNLFVFHPSIEPVYITYNASAVSKFTFTSINVQIRDLTGISEGVPDNLRPSTLTDIHKYNIQNQGWLSGNPWSTNSTTTINVTSGGSKAFTVPAGLTGISVSQYVLIQAYQSIQGTTYFYPLWVYGNVTSYVGTTLTINTIAPWNNPNGVTTFGGTINPSLIAFWTITPFGVAYTDTWFTQLGNYPSNADQWWRFKDNNGSFAPSTTVNNRSLGLGAAPKGHYLLNAFDQQRDQASGVLTITDITTLKRPTNGCWFQGRLFYTGVSASQQPTGNAAYYTWNENIYFSQVVQKVEDYGKCYQNNDPTSEELFDLLPTDGGVIVVQGSGTIYHLQPYQNGILVFCANGIKFIVGSQGIGFTANDYTITDISTIPSISTSSYVTVQGLQYFWNEDGIYVVTPQQGGGLAVEPITVGTIQSFFDEIPKSCKKLARGVYNPVEYTIQWIYRDTDFSNNTEKFTYNSILTYNTYNKAFYPYSIDTTSGHICGIVYVSGPGGSTNIDPSFKYLCTEGTTISLADEHDEDYVDWASFTPVNFDSFFLTGYRVQGAGLTRFQMPLVNLFSEGGSYFAYKIQGVWDYAQNGNTGRWTTKQLVQSDGEDYGFFATQRRIRGNGRSLQLKITSVDGAPFNLIGWATLETINQAP